MLMIDWDAFIEILKSWNGEIWVWERSKFKTKLKGPFTGMVQGNSDYLDWLFIECENGEYEIPIRTIRKISIHSRINITLNKNEGP
jgi:hypothetical protein